MLLEKLAKRSACRRCETPSRLYERELQLAELTRENLRLQHVLDEAKKARAAALAEAEHWRSWSEAMRDDG